MKPRERFLKALALVCLAALLEACAVPCARAEEYYVKVGPRGVHFRATPENDLTGKNILGTVHAFEVLRALEEADGWHRVVYQGRTGYVSAAYVRRTRQRPGKDGGESGEDETMGAGESSLLSQAPDAVMDFGTGWATASTDTLTLRALKYADDPRAVGSDYLSYGGIPVEAERSVGPKGARLRCSPYDRQDAAVLMTLQAGTRVYVLCLFDDEWAGDWAYVKTKDGTLGFISAGLLE